MEKIEEARTGIRPPAGWILALLVLAAGVNLLYLDWGLPNHYSWAPDAVHPYKVLDAMDRGFSGGWYDKYPPLPYMLYSAVFLPVMAGFESSRIESLWKAKNAYMESTYPERELIDPQADREVLTALILAGRALNAIMGALAAVGCMLAARELFGNLAGFLTGLIVAFHPFSIFYSHTMNTEAPYFMWSAFGIYCWFRALKRQDGLSFAGLGLFAALAGATKQQAIGLFAFMPFVLIHARAARRIPKRPGPLQLMRAIVDGKILLGAGTFVLASLLANNLVFNLKGYLDHLAFNAPGVSVLERIHPWTLGGCLDLTVETVTWILRTASLPVFMICMGGLVLTLFLDWRKALAVLLPILSYFAVFLLAIGFLAPRYVTPMFFLLAMFGGKFLRELCLFKSAPRLVRGFALFVTILYIVGLGFGVDLIFRDDPRYETEAWMEKNIPEGARVLALATPKTMVCRLPRGPYYFPVDVMEDLDRTKALSRKRPPDYLVLHAFPGNLRWFEPLSMEDGFKKKIEKIGYETIAVQAPRWSHPVGRYLFFNPLVFIAKRVEKPR